MTVSILHRISGGALGVGGLALLLWWLGALASGGRAYETFLALAGSPLGIVVLVGISWAFFNHLCSGIRHFVLDLGAGYELKSNRAWSLASMAGGVLLTAAFWAAIYLA